LVAKQLGIHATLIELKPEYAAMAERRIANLPATAPEMDREEDAPRSRRAHSLPSRKRPEGEPQGPGAVNHAGPGESPAAAGPEPVPFGLDAGETAPDREPIELPDFLRRKKDAA
jgi:hypothetical protein